MFYLDLHSHSVASDDSRATVEQYLKWVRSLRSRGHQIDGVVLTEHRRYDESSDYSALSQTYGVSVLKGAELSKRTFGSACHGAGRLLSRSEARRRYGNRNIAKDLQEQGVFVLGASRATIVEEVPQAYKDVAEVVGVVHEAGLAERVAQIKPIGCVKG